MFFSRHVSIYVATCPVDFRRSFNGLCGIVREEFGKDPFSHALFIFVNKQRTQIKILWGNEKKICIHMERLHEGTFRLPYGEERCIEISVESLSVILEGSKETKQRHKKREEKVDSIVLF